MHQPPCHVARERRGLPKTSISPIVTDEWAQQAFFKILNFMQPTTEKKANPILWLFRYVKESREEMKKVSWPTNQVTTKYSLIVIVLSLFIAGFFGGLDWLLNEGLDWLISITS
jgi:preprotein translocase subunit SecE